MQLPQLLGNQRNVNCKGLVGGNLSQTAILCARCHFAIEDLFPLAVFWLNSTNCSRGPRLHFKNNEIMFKFIVHFDYATVSKDCFI